MFINIDLIIFGAVNKHYHIGILLYRARFAKVGKYGFCCGGTFLRCTAQLGKRDYRNIEFLGKTLQSSRNTADLLLAVPFRIMASLHELKVIHDHQVQSLFHLQAPRFGANLHDAQRRSVFDQEWSVPEPAQSAGELVPIFAV